MKKKSGLKRFAIGLAQHLLAAAAMVAVAGLLLNAYITVESIDGMQTYKVFSTNMGPEFEESDVYHDLFRNAVSDITQLVVIKEQLETDEIFDSTKKIDVTEYVKKIGQDSDCPVTAVYELDELIRWGKYGVNYTTSSMSMTEFVEYFGYVLFPENFALDEYGQLCFDGFHRIEQEEIAADPEAEGEKLSEEGHYGKSEEELAMLSEMLSSYTGEQQEDMVFSYIMAKNLEGIEVSREDDGRLRVSVSMLNCRYDTVDGKRRLIEYADNWVDYMQLQENLAAAVDNLTLNYQRYQLCNEAYAGENTNVKYMIRMMTDEGMQTYTNVSEIKNMDDEDVTEYFCEYRRYLIYYPDSLVFMGNTLLSEEELDEYIGVYAYAYPDTTHIWIGMDTNYTVEGDAFHNAYTVYESVIPNIGRIIAVIVLLAVLWLAAGTYLTLTTGTRHDENGVRITQMNRIDHIWTEVFFLLAAAAVYGGVLGCRMIQDVAASAGMLPLNSQGIQLTKLYQYGVFGLYGACVSVTASIFWFSLVRRIKCGSMWKNSLLYWIGIGFGKLMRFVFRHGNSVISTLIPYNLFLFANLAALVVAYKLNSVEERRMVALLILYGLVIFDCIIGVMIFKRNAERIEIVEGINKIRDGEVDFKLDPEALHGENKELADAVNNIGEGIRKAVKTSMKDEQMKSDLITNVSHDIKTPLTSIINYIDLLKRLKIEEEPARGYIAILDTKAQRLKQLTDDLVEASKISSGNIELNREKLNLSELINQGIGEFSEKLEENKLQVVFETSDQPAYIFADSRRMWRVMENLFNNICKYAMENTRVYIDVTVENGMVDASVKNISKQQMNISPEELTERFIRGDSSRSTEGSGLGLSIAKNLVQVQGGAFEIVLDGDLFKIVFGFPEYEETKTEEQETNG